MALDNYDVWQWHCQQYNDTTHTLLASIRRNTKQAAKEGRASPLKNFPVIKLYWQKCRVHRCSPLLRCTYYELMSESAYCLTRANCRRAEKYKGLIKLLSFFYPTNVNWQLDQMKKTQRSPAGDRTRVFRLPVGCSNHWATKTRQERWGCAVFFSSDPAVSSHLSDRKKKGVWLDGMVPTGLMNFRFEQIQRYWVKESMPICLWIQHAEKFWYSSKRLKSCGVDMPIVMLISDELFPFFSCTRTSKEDVHSEHILTAVRASRKQVLGRGAYAEVYAGVWEAPVAVKVLHEELVDENVDGRDDFIACFWREGMRLMKLRHTNIVSFFGMYRMRNGAPAMVMEKMETTLEQHYCEQDVSTIGAVGLFCDISAGLAYLHANNMIHRDLTTRNIMLTAGENRCAKIGDFGISRSVTGITSGDPILTDFPGTPLYMSPESRSPWTHHGHGVAQYNEKHDCFSFGVLMMATLVRKEPPFQLLTTPLLEAPEIERRRKDYDEIPDDNPVKQVIEKCLRNDPTGRPSAAKLHRIFVKIAERLGARDQVKEVSSVVHLLPL